MSLVKQVRSLAGEVLSRENAAREKARREYPQLLEDESTEPEKVTALQEAMRLLNKSPADLSADVQTLTNYRDLQAKMKAGTGLDAATQRAIDATKQHREETQRIMAARAEKDRQLRAEESRLGNLYSNAQQAVHDMTAMRSKYADLLINERAVTVEDLA